MRFHSRRQPTNVNDNALAKAAQRAIEPLENRVLFAAGDLDPTFGTNGRTIDTQDGAIHDVLVLDDGRTLVAGTQDNDFYVAMYRKNGSLDTSFSGDGRVTIDFSGRNDVATALAVQSDGKIIVAGHSNGDFALTRLTTTGSVDGTFGNAGRRLTDAGAAEILSDVVVDDDDSVIAAGRTSGLAVDPDVHVVLAKYDADGNLVDDFADAGLSIEDFASTMTDNLVKIAIDSDGDIIGVGTFLSADFGDTGNFGIFRYTADGQVIFDFDTNGIQRFNFRRDGNTFSDDIATALILLDDGTLVIGGTVDGDFGLVRMNPNGTPDTTFGGGDGRVTTDLPTSGADVRDVSMVMDEDGRIVLGATLGISGHAQRDIVIARYTETGALDNSFGTGGLVTSSFADNGSQQVEHLTGVAISDDGDIVAIGNADGKPFIARYLSELQVPTAPGALVIDGTKNDDVITVNRDGDELVVSINGKVQRHALDEVTELIINGKAGNDRITVGKKLDLNATISGGKGADTLRGGAGNDELLGNSGRDELFGRAGRDTLVGGKAGDRLDGGKGADELLGNTGHDRLLGRSGNDTLVGGKGDDTLNGGSGADELRGQSGADRFFTRDSIADALFGGTGKDSARVDELDDLNSIAELLA